MRDVIVIGAGPAGCEIAYRLAQKNLDVQVIDKELDREKPCGGGINFQEIDEFDVPDHIFERKITALTIISPKNNILTTEMPANKYCATVKRRDYDGYLQDRARKAGAVFEQRKIEDITALSAKLIVNARGVFGISKPPRGLEMYATYHLWMAGDIDARFTNSFEIYLLEKLKGYVWIFPKKNVVSVGIGSIGKTSLKSLLHDFIANHPIAAEKLKGLDICKEEGGLIPTNIIPQLYSKNIISIGDAGGFANLFHGGGIYQARKSAKIAAPHCEKFLETGMIKHLAAYDREARIWFNNHEIKWDTKMRNLLWNEKILEILTNRGKQDKQLQKALRIIITSEESHETGYRILENKMIDILYSEMDAKTDPWKKDINSRLERLFPGPHDLHRWANEMLLNDKAKRLRAYIGVVASDLFNGSREDAVNFSLVYELFHTASLIHDDIIDESEKRRGRQTLHTKYGIGNAVITGDLMLSKGYSLISMFSDNLSKKQIQDGLQVVGETGEKCCLGQSLDMSMAENKEYSSIEDYIHMVELKTGSLIEGAMKGGAIGAGASPEQVDIIGDFGRNMGIAFQIIDDSLDLLGGEKANKSIMNDLKQGKATPMLIYSLKRERPDLLLSAVGDKNLTEETAQRVTDIYRNNGAIEYAQQLSHVFIEKARKALKKLPQGPASKEFEDLLEILAFWSAGEIQETQ
jgi:geranylgeranyl reductase family protein